MVTISVIVIMIMFNSFTKSAVPLVLNTPSLITALVGRTNWNSNALVTHLHNSQTWIYLPIPYIMTLFQIVTITLWSPLQVPSYFEWNLIIIVLTTSYSSITSLKILTCHDSQQGLVHHGAWFTRTKLVKCLYASQLIKKGDQLSMSNTPRPIRLSNIWQQDIEYL